jgi:hypothetical protein
MTKGADLIKVRHARADDRAFIENAWRATMLALSSSAQGAEPGHFHGEMTRVFERIIPGSTLRVASDVVDDSTLVGFACATGPELHYVYIAGPFRKMGVVARLLEGLEIKRYTFRTDPGMRRLRPRERGWVYTPRFTL